MHYKLPMTVGGDNVCLLFDRFHVVVDPVAPAVRGYFLFTSFEVSVEVFMRRLSRMTGVEYEVWSHFRDETNDDFGIFMNHDE